MFSFHRPKVYRSSTGCCICKAKSSSSRFTDSKKYEEDFLECFKLATPRQGEICNACVLLVKRWKKLPAGSDRNWRHVVDARAGPGMKSLTKFKSKNRKNEAKTGAKKVKPHFDRECSPGLSDKSDGPEDVDMADMDCLSEEGPSMGSSRNASPGLSDTEDNVEHPRGKSRRRMLKPRRRDPDSVVHGSFIDMDYWTKKTICCGAVFYGRHNELLVVRELLKPCAARLAMQQKAATSTPVAVVATTPTTAVTKTVYSDNSSDSGYDDSSNQAMSPDAQEKVVTPAPANQIVDLVCHETIFGAEEEIASNVSLSLVSRQDSYAMVVRN